MQQVVTPEDEIMRPVESIQEFDRSSELFYEADRLNYSDLDSASAEKNNPSPQKTMWNSKPRKT